MTRIDRRLGKLGRLTREYGTDDPDQRSAIDAMLTELRSKRQWDVLALLFNKVMSPLDLWEARTRGDDLPTGDEARNLERSAEHWLTNSDLTKGTVADYRRVLTPFYSAHAVLGDLPEKLRRDRERAIHNGKRRTFNIRRSACLSMLAYYVDDQHKLYRAVRRVEALHVNVRPRNPQTVEQVRAIAQQMGANAEILWAICLTGMRQREFWKRPWKDKGDRIYVPGVKGKHGTTLPREVPKVYPIAQPRVGYSRFYHHLGKLTDGTVNVHDLRATYMTWLEEIGVPRIRRRIYVGHQVKDVSELYERRDVSKFLGEDAERLRTFIGAPPAMGQGLKLA